MASMYNEILSQLDACASGFAFPVLDNGYIYLAGSRLSALSDKTRWMIVIEMVGFNPRYLGDHSFNTLLYRFGNCIAKPGHINNAILYPISSGHSGSILEDSQWVNSSITDIVIRGHLYPLLLDTNFFAKAKVRLKQPPKIHGAELLRGLMPEHRLELLASTAELASPECSGLPLILQLDEWQHPDVLNEQMPSSCDSFQQLAAVLQHADSSYYQASAITPNTHWENWPDGGGL